MSNITKSVEVYSSTTETKRTVKCKSFIKEYEEKYNEERTILKKEMQKLYEVLTLRRKKKVKCEEKTQESFEDQKEEEIYANCGWNNISTQTDNFIMEQRTSTWRKSFRFKKNKKTKDAANITTNNVENCTENHAENHVANHIDNNAEINNETSFFSRTTLRNTYANTRRSLMKINLKNRPKSVVQSDDAIWEDTISQTSNVSFRAKISKLKKVFKDGVKVFKREQVTEL